ncbi:MAG TPA: AsmA family protein, partial [Burkholderiales bacterium]|nr:AsmA family protein [Burkholderiales bacterium]
RAASLTARLAVAPFELQPLTQLEFVAKDFDPRAWSATAPQALISGEGRLVADNERTLSGAFSFANTLAGTIDERKLPFAQASAAMNGTLAQLAFQDLKLDLADAGQFAGDGAWKGGSLDVALVTRNFNLRGVQKRLHKTQLAGQLALGGNAQTQRVRFALTQQPYRFRFAGALNEGIARIDEAYASAGNAALTTRGTVALDQQKTFAVAGRLSNFDPSRFGNYPSARINGRFELKGHVDPVLQVAANVNLTDSRLFGLPATAQGMFRSRNTEQPDVAMDVTMRIGDTRASAKGTVRDPAKLSSMDMQLSLAGASLADLYKIVGVPMPPTPPYRIQGRLVQNGQTWALRQFAGAVGDSDLAGTFVIDRSRSPQLMSAELTSNRLALADLSGFIGAEKTATGQVTTPNPARVLPDSPYNLEKLKSADADIRFQGKRIITERLPVDDMSAHLILKGGVLTLAPLNFGVAGGKLVSNITLDGRASQIASRADIRVQSLQLERIMPKLKVSKASVGELDGRVRLTARGNSIAAMLGSANGDTSLAIGEGDVSDLILRLSNLDIANTLLVLLRGDRNIPLRCMVADLKFENGVMRPRQFIFDTAHTTLTAEGQADFNKETLDLRLIAKPKGRSLVSLRGPIGVGGTFANPS